MHSSSQPCRKCPRQAPRRFGARPRTSTTFWARALRQPSRSLSWTSLSPAAARTSPRPASRPSQGRWTRRAPAPSCRRRPRQAQAPNCPRRAGTSRWPSIVTVIRARPAAAGRCVRRRRLTAGTMEPSDQAAARGGGALVPARGLRCNGDGPALALEPKPQVQRETRGSDKPPPCCSAGLALQR